MIHRKYRSNAIIIQRVWEENKIIFVIKAIYKDFESMRMPHTSSANKKPGEGVSRFASVRHYQIPTDTKF